MHITIQDFFKGRNLNPKDFLLIKKQQQQQQQSYTF